MAFELLVESAELDDSDDDCYGESYYDTDLDMKADRILNQYDTDELYQEGALADIAGFGALCFVGGLRLILHPWELPETLLACLHPEWGPLFVGFTASAIATSVAAFKGIRAVVRICKSGKNVHKDLCEIADMISDDKNPEPKKIYKVFKNLKKDLKALKMRFNAFTEEERKVMGELIDSTNKIITMTKSDATDKEKIKTVITDFLQDAKKVDDIIANPAKKQEMVKA